MNALSVRDGISGFLAAHGFAAATPAPLAQDASFRRYFRIRGGPRPAVLMDAPPGREDVGPFLRIQAHLEAAGLSVPEVLAADPARGFVLLEDLGDALFPSVLTSATLPALYDAAVDALAALHAAPPPPGLPAWDAAAMTAAAGATFLDWWWPEALGVPPPAAARAAFAAAMADLLAPVGTAAALVHRDYFADNLFWLPDRGGIRRVGIIDFQDAAAGHPAYDLVSLAEDARRDLPDGLAERLVGRYLGRRPELDPVAFRAAYAACAAQRHLRVASLWVRLAARDGKPAYLAHGPRCWRLLERALRRPDATPLDRFMDRFVAPALRGNPAGRAA